ncbi:MAG: TIGR03936 family radical SAM-associated protein, partial [Acetatifactor sp.]|nr:TIGR03936 family radical SAM-associated protein [Acetatifactor sp.]
MNQKRIRYNWHEADASVMEGVLARGDRRLGQVILKVYQKGGYFDAWSEYYDHQKWLETIRECGLSVAFYTSRHRELDEIFPWDFIDCGVTKEFLKREWLKAQTEQISENCKLKCQGCGAARFGGGICTEPRDTELPQETAKSELPQESAKPAPQETAGPQTVSSPQNAGIPKPAKIPNIRLRIKFTKHGAIRFIGHLDVMRFFQKAIRRAGIDVAYTGGYSPHQIMSFAAPLGVGAESNGEYMDIEVRSLTSCEDVMQRLNESCVPGIRITGVCVLPEEAGNAMASVAAASYTVRFAPGKAPGIDMTQVLPRFLEKESILITKEGKRGPREVDIRPGIYSCHWEQDALHLLVDASSAGNIKPAQIMDSLLR